MGWGGGPSRCKPGVCCTPRDRDRSPSVASLSVICHHMKDKSSPVLVRHLPGSQTHRQYPGSRHQGIIAQKTFLPPQPLNAVNRSR